MITLQLRHGPCFVDEELAPVLLPWHWWSAVSTRQRRLTYAIGRPLGQPQATPFSMHRLIMGLPRQTEDSRDVDHINGNGLDNQRQNLRLASRSQNLANSASRPGSSRFKGVSWDSGTNRWKAQITVGGRGRNLGRYVHEENAALAYNDTAREAWGEYAQLNAVDPAAAPSEPVTKTSQFKGVSWDKHRSLWIAVIGIGGYRHLGRFASEQEAADAYQRARAEIEAAE